MKTGHAGTLDPFATGLLIVLLGRPATREQARFMGLRKIYRARARFGAVSTTGDPEGEITETGVVPASSCSRPARCASARRPTRRSRSAGERAYKRARRGEEFEMPERIVTVHRFELLEREGDEAEFEIECSSGTYVRSLIADLGDAYCTALRRHRDRAVRGRRGRRGGADPPRRRARPPVALVSAREHRGHAASRRRAARARSRSARSTASTSAIAR